MQTNPMVAWSEVLSPIKRRLEMKKTLKKESGLFSSDTLSKVKALGESKEIDVQDWTFCSANSLEKLFDFVESDMVIMVGKHHNHINGKVINEFAFGFTF